jgi:hypothetical protein
MTNISREQSGQLEKWRWGTFFEYLMYSPFITPDEILASTNIDKRPIYEIGMKVTIIKPDNYLHWMIASPDYIPNDDDECTTGIITCKSIVTDDILDTFKLSKIIMFKPEYMPMFERVMKIIKDMYIGRTVYCVHTDDLAEEGSDLLLSLPWVCPSHYSHNICDKHVATEEHMNNMQFLHYTCYYLCI